MKRIVIRADINGLGIYFCIGNKRTGLAAFYVNCGGTCARDIKLTFNIVIDACISARAAVFVTCGIAGLIRGVGRIILFGFKCIVNLVTEHFTELIGRPFKRTFRVTQLNFALINIFVKFVG